MREPNNNNEELDRGQNSGGKEGAEVPKEKGMTLPTKIALIIGGILLVTVLALVL